MGSLKNIRVGVSVLILSAAMTIVTVSGQSSRKVPSKVDNGGMLTLCHATGSQENPYETITVSDNGVAHRRHLADIIPAPVEGCPGPVPNDDPPGPTPTPEPVTVLLFAAGVAAAGYAARKFKRTQ